MTNDRICILGGTGFVGYHLATGLSASGYPCRLLARRPERHRELSLVPGSELRRADLFETGALEEHLKGCAAVVNLVGILNEGGGRTFQQTHVDLVERILDAAQAAAVPRYLHMSALHAQAEQGTSRYLRTKGMGEDLAHARTGMQVTSFRPSVVFGPSDGFFNRFCHPSEGLAWGVPPGLPGCPFRACLCGRLGVRHDKGPGRSRLRGETL